MSGLQRSQIWTETTTQAVVPSWILIVINQYEMITIAIMISSMDRRSSSSDDYDCSQNDGLVFSFMLPRHDKAKPKSTILFDL